MAEEQTQAVTGAALKKRAEQAIEKARRESFEGKLKAVVIKRQEAQRTLNLLDKEIRQMVEDFDNGE